MPTRPLPRTGARFTYPVDLQPDEDGRVVARVRDVTGAVTDGTDRPEALLLAHDALEEALCAAMAGHEDIPWPSPARGRPVVAPGTLVAAKAALYEAMRDAKISNVELGRRMGVSEVEVRRLLDPRHNSKIGRLDEALAALGKRVILEVRDVA